MLSSNGLAAEQFMMLERFVMVHLMGHTTHVPNSERSQACVCSSTSTVRFKLSDVGVERPSPAFGDSLLHMPPFEHEESVSCRILTVF